MHRIRTPSIRMHAAALAAALMLTAGAASAQEALTAAKVKATLEAQGYTNVHDVEFDDGMWKADATSADGKKTDVRLDASGKVFPEDRVATIGEADVRAKLAAAGYTNVHDLDYDDGLWKAEARDPTGKDVELRLDGDTDEIVGGRQD